MKRTILAACAAVTLASPAAALDFPERYDQSAPEFRATLCIFQDSLLRSHPGYELSQGQVNMLTATGRWDDVMTGVRSLYDQASSLYVLVIGLRMGAHMGGKAVDQGREDCIIFNSPQWREEYGPDAGYMPEKAPERRSHYDRHSWELFEE